MLRMQLFTTAGLDPHRRLAHWNECAEESFSPLISDPADIGTFHGSIERTDIGEVSLTEDCSEAQTVHHSRAHVARTRSALFFLMLQISGECRDRQDGREAFLKPGDFTLVDTTRPYNLFFPGSHRTLVLSVPDTVLRRWVGFPEGLVAVPVRATGGVAALLSRLLRDFWVACHQDLDAPAAAGVTPAVLDLLGSAYADVPRPRGERRAVATARRTRIIGHIEAHLHDPALTPTRIADCCRITPRYLHHLFAASDETVGRYLLRRRLEECARALVSTVHLERPVAAIAFEHGFNSATHFGRAFRSKYGMTPREYRELHSDQIKERIGS